MNVMIRMGTNMLLLSGGGRDINILVSALTLAKSIITLEHYVDSVNVAANNRVVLQIKLRDLNSGSIRDALKFYSKRVPCSCLKGMYREARRAIPKMGLCWYCGQKRERVALSVCSRCMVMQYCSRECQVAHWPKHKVDCGNLVGGSLLICGRVANDE